MVTWSGSVSLLPAGACVGASAASKIISLNLLDGQSAWSETANLRRRSDCVLDPDADRERNPHQP